MRKAHTIAEVANYWHGDENVLKETITNAAACSVDFLKVQLPNPERLGNPWKPKKAFIQNNEIKESLLHEIKAECDRYGLSFLATVNHAEKVELCQRQNVSNVKIASGQIHPLLIDAIRAHKWKRVFVSTGMIETVDELALISDLQDCTDELVVMHCVSLYPTYDCELNLSRIETLCTFFGGVDRCQLSLGYSDHHMDDLACFVAYGLGANYIERHFRIETSFGPTSEIALTPKDMGNFTGLCKRMSVMYGDGTLTMQDREANSRHHYKTRYII